MEFKLVEWLLLGPLRRTGFRGQTKDHLKTRGLLHETSGACMLPLAQWWVLAQVPISSIHFFFWSTGVHNRLHMERRLQRRTWILKKDVASLTCCAYVLNNLEKRNSPENFCLTSPQTMGPGFPSWIHSSGSALTVSPFFTSTATVKHTCKKISSCNVKKKNSTQ